MLRHALSILAAALEFVALENCDASAHRQADALPIIRSEQESPPSSAHPNLLRIVDWNIAAGRLATIDAIAARLATFDADVITLQELDVDTERSGEIDEPAPFVLCYARAADTWMTNKPTPKTPVRSQLSNTCCRWVGPLQPTAASPRRCCRGCLVP
jgi:hypothetical protein